MASLGKWKSAMSPTFHDYGLRQRRHVVISSENARMSSALPYVTFVKNESQIAKNGQFGKLRRTLEGTFCCIEFRSHTF
jgi:hypothetical protein